MRRLPQIFGVETEVGIWSSLRKIKRRFRNRETGVGLNGGGERRQPSKCLEIQSRPFRDFIPSNCRDLDQSRDQNRIAQTGR